MSFVANIRALDLTGIEPAPRVCQERYATITPQAQAASAQYKYTSKRTPLRGSFCDIRVDLCVTGTVHSIKS